MAGKRNEARGQLLLEMWLATAKRMEAVADTGMVGDIAGALRAYRELASAVAENIERLEDLGERVIAEPAGRYGDGD